MNKGKIKHYDTVYKEGLTYEQAYKNMENGFYATRPEWGGFHFIEGGRYCIFLKTKSLLINPKYIYDEDKTDWMIVRISKEALDIIEEKLELRD